MSYELSCEYLENRAYASFDYNLIHDLSITIEYYHRWEINRTLVSLVKMIIADFILFSD